MMELCNRFNSGYRFIRVCVEEDGSTICDYYMTYDGGLDPKNFVMSLEWFAQMKELWSSLVRKSGEENRAAVGGKGTSPGK